MRNLFIVMKTIQQNYDRLWGVWYTSKAKQTKFHKV